MKIGIIGAGFTGLTAGLRLSQAGHKVIIFERDDKPGGLAVGYKEKEWDWTLEKHYHHWFTNDKSVLNLAKELNYKVFSPRPKTSSFVDNEIVQFDSPLSLLKFNKLSPFERVRMGTSLAFLRYNKYWKPFEKYRAEKYLMNSMGQRAYKLLWEPLMKNKLGKYSPDVSLAWFWARIYKRTSSLTYPEGGFLRFAERIAQEVTQNKGKIYYNSEILNLESKESPSVTYTNQADLKRKTEKFDAVIVTLPISLFIKIAPSLPKFYVTKNASLKNIAAVNTVLRLNKPLFGDGTYWLSMCDINSPILAIVEHTNFMDKKHYNNEHLVYLGNNLETNDPRYTMSDKELLSLYDPWIKKINPDYASSLIAYKTFHAPFAQPIIFRNYSKNIPSTKTPLKNVHLANIQQVYPWDRGTNYAVELGEKIAHEISKIQ